MNGPITVTFVPEQVITWIIIGLIAGVLASVVIRGRRLGFIGNIVIGLLGALLGGFLFTLLHVQLPSIFNGSITLRWADIFIAFVGALLILLIFGAFYHSRRPLT